METVDNLVVMDSPYTASDLETLFCGEEIRLIENTDLSSLAVQLGGYKSKSQARKAGRVGPIPLGWTEWKVNKLRRVWIWNPSE